MQIQSIVILIVCYFAICTGNIYAQRSSYAGSATATLPSVTDSRIVNFNQSHLSWLPASSPRNQLLVFLPGTGGQPRANFPFTATAASLGYHAISLMYPDEVAAQQACINSPDPEAYMKFRLAVIQGGDAGSAGVIAPADSIENRLTQLVRYLKATQRNQGWDQFLDSNNQLDWSKIAISGQSQGGGHAYVISKIHTVGRVLMFGSPKDYSFYFRRPAQGFDGNTRTPLNRYFAFNDLKDTKGGCNHEMQLQIFEQIGLTRLGSVIAEQAKNFNHARLIFTDSQQANPHGAVIIGSAPTCGKVWTYMLTEPVQ